MRVFATSDLHVDHDANARWVKELSQQDFQDDVLILAGDISDRMVLLEWTLTEFAKRFSQVLFVPGNHDLWVVREDMTSLEKLSLLSDLAAQVGVETSSWATRELQIIPLQGWYDYSFAEPGPWLRRRWMDFRACSWPEFQDDPLQVAKFFDACNAPMEPEAVSTVITFSHFLPRIDVMPHRIPAEHRRIYPVLGTSRLDRHIRRLGASLHVYGHSHVNRHVGIDGIQYVNNAFGYPRENRIARKQLLCIYENGALTKTDNR